MAGVLTNNGNTGNTQSRLFLQRFNGTAWVDTLAGGILSTVNPTRRNFDIAYEYTTGRPMVVYSSGTSVVSRTFDGSTWSSPTTIATQTGNIEWVELKSRNVAGSNGIALAYAWNDGLTGHSLRAARWTGTAWEALSGQLSSNLVYPGTCLLYTSPSPRDRTRSRMPSSA
jgi:hypothetical protein